MNGTCPDTQSARSCGCDPGACHVCAEHLALLQKELKSPLPQTDAARKATPLWTGVFLYFPDALCAVARVSQAGNDQHNPGEPLHWARGKSMDQMNTAVRHMLDHSTGRQRDTDGTWHLAKAAWRLLAELQLTIEQEEGR